jgi:hypothetical protein
VAAALAERGALDIMPVIVVKWMLSAFVDTLPEETVGCVFVQNAFPVCKPLAKLRVFLPKFI